MEELRQQLAGTIWKWPDPKVKVRWFKLNPDGTVTAGWHNKPGTWVVTSNSTAEVVVASTNRIPVKVEVNWGPEATMKSESGEVYKQIK